jgi:hypothetical protein
MRLHEARSTPTSQFWLLLRNASPPATQTRPNTGVLHSAICGQENSGLLGVV